MFRPVLVMLVVATWASFTFAQDAPADDKLKRLIDRIAKGDEVDADDAAEQLVEQLYGPLTRAIGALEKLPGTDKDRPVVEQIRIRKAIARLNASLRMRMCRLDLPDEDRKLFDKFVKEYPDLTANLFADSYTVRKAAIESIPLDKGTGAGVMICARVNDEDDDVASAALEAALKLKDEVVGRGILGYIKAATAAVKDENYLKELGSVLLPALAEIVHQCFKPAAAIKPPDAAPVLVDAFRTFLRLKQWDGAQRADVVRLMAELGDERVATALLEAMESAQHAEFRALQGGTTVVQTVGDAALLGLLKLYGLKPEAFNLTTNEEWGTFSGFSDDKSRQEAYRRFRIWYEQNGSRPREQRQTPASKPSGRD